MDVIMCLSCGTFVRAVRHGEAVDPLQNQCPECGGREFTDIDTGRTIYTEGEPKQ
jgi:Zn finger protein HypA/HybF involved in hydrogenase expression